VIRPRVNPHYQNTPRQEIVMPFTEEVRASLVVTDLNVVHLGMGQPVPASAFRLVLPPNGPSSEPYTSRWVPLEPLPSGRYRAILPAGSVQDAGGNTLAQDAVLEFEVPVPSARVVGRHLFYNDSAFDGNGAALDLAAVRNFSAGPVAVSSLRLHPGRQGEHPDLAAARANLFRSLPGIALWNNGG
jgi:hypothetical protein